MIQARRCGRCCPTVEQELRLDGHTPLLAMAAFIDDSGALSLLGLAAVRIVVFRLVSSQVPRPYMDEIFHVPQAQHYCMGSFSQWDPKITTFPGLYLIAASLSPAFRLMNYMGGAADDSPFDSVVCSTGQLRSVNAYVLGPLCDLLVFCILSRTYVVKGGSVALRLIRVALFPPHWFYQLLFYTDTAATATLLLAYYLYLSDRPRLSGLAGSVAVMCRQTNVVWVAGMAGLIAWDALTDEERRALPMSLLRRGNGGEGEGWPLCRVLHRVWLHAAVCAAFLAFVVFVNEGSIVVGDRSHHRPVLHWAQLPYLYAYLVCFLLPPVVCAAAGEMIMVKKEGGKKEIPVRTTEASKDATRVLVSVKRALFACTVFLVCYLCVHHGTCIHPFLLADNRHFVFYLWRRLLQKPLVRLYALPLSLSVTSLFSASIFPSSCRLIECMCFAACCVLTLVPAQLLELRYFMVPAMLVLMHQRPLGMWGEAGGVVMHAALCAALVGVFAYLPFVWGDGTEARFML
ncbi:unnamed protein product [Vitrella brassicaformis CCMP3155]|uniref:Dol-P-Glc:Glc(2)Man(9)GlcNAc(2)-PP-Dol alpha-1,2-glucosyltransferase n=2 Tax=Vitrella brassicaformis TaxID=1169539 RepID=A0A0G4GW52_VITBC|nr:unnamed protein product [Vitrella brassicaformis CCMP3155]|eukprot:CEM35193.1 unnamed protein product [Vitrella brassicaformis CCMP3155]